MFLLIRRLSLYVYIAVLIEYEETWKYTTESDWCSVFLDVLIMRILKKKLAKDNIVLDVFVICQKLRHVQVIKKTLLRTHRPSKKSSKASTVR